MAWNGSDQTASGAPRSRGRISPKCATPVDANFCSRPVDAGPCPRRKNTNPTALHLLSRPTFFFLLLLALAGAAVWYFFLRPVDAVSRPRPEKPKKSAPITAVTPALAHTNRVVKPEQPKKVEKPRPYWELPSTNGFSETMQHKWRVMHRPRPSHTNNIEDIRHRARSSIFRYRSENMIAALLMVKPGESMIGTPSMAGINEDFLRSCEEPILPSEDDDDYNRNLKKMMNETKIELRQRIANGESLEEIVRDTHKELQRLAQYRSELRLEIAKNANDGERTDEEVADLVKAANIMLEEKGVAPIELGPITKSRLKHMNVISKGQQE